MTGHRRVRPEDIFRDHPRRFPLIHFTGRPGAASQSGS
jgi:hypothetical protein